MVPADKPAPVICEACKQANAADHPFCARCGRALAGSAPTRTSPAPRPQATPSGEAARFLPGAILAGRYRMVALLGRGGMGEVYRADDLKLGQPVALKFLPRGVEQDPDRLERFLTEVRLALRVTHPNVCRVFDIAQADGRHFLSMEYVDGEDLASLLRRIGRLPEDKAIQIARQLCAGLAAAHDEGVLHRDLKPANVMIDGRGRAKITDFGLAGATAGIRGLEARAGTPQYMAPEQVAGGELSERTDVYALGLVLHELFTGKRPFDGKGAVDPAHRRRSTPAAPSADFRGIDPAVERAIQRCLEADPALRPVSASAVAAALPGGDPLAMALAAGETPSPELVALSGGRGELSPAVATACLAVVLIGLLGVWVSSSRVQLQNRVPMPMPPGELAAAARAVATAGGYPTRGSYSALGFDWMPQYFTKIAREDQSAGRWDTLPHEKPSPVRFWYRESPAPLTPSNNLGRVFWAEPPLLVPGMIRIFLDPDGTLQEFRAVTPYVPDATESWPEPDWKPFLTAARLDGATLVTAVPHWPPPAAADVRRAWTSGELRVEATGFRGRVVWFSVVPPWRNATAPEPPTPSVQLRVVAFLALTVIAAGVLLARRNLRLGRSDARGATRLGVAYVTVGVAADLLTFNGIAFLHLINTVAVQFFYGAIVWVFYVALEPYVRRLWPDTLTSWTRVLDGRWRDPLVGRHVLVGAVGGIIAAAIMSVPQFTTWFGPPAMPTTGAFLGFWAPRFNLAAILTVVQQSIFAPFSALLLLLLLRVVLRRPWLAYAALFALVIVVSLGRPMLDVAVAFATTVLAVGILTRFGVLALIVTILFWTWELVPLTTDVNSWYFVSSAITIALFAAVAVYAFVVSLGGRIRLMDPALDS
jgi:hypothetical protein